MPIAGRNQKPERRAEGIDWARWFCWIRETFGIDDGVLKVMEELERIKERRGCLQEIAEQELDRTLRSLRWKIQNGANRDEIERTLGRILHAA